LNTWLEELQNVAQVLQQFRLCLALSCLHIALEDSYESLWTGRRM